MCYFLFTKLTKHTAFLPPDQGNCQSFGQQNAIVESWIVPQCSLLPAFSKQKRPFFFSRKAWKLCPFVQPKIYKDDSDIWQVQQENCFGRAIGSRDQLKASHLSVAVLTRRAFVAMSVQKGLPLWILLINNKDNGYWASFKLARSAWFYVTKAILINYKLVTNQNKAIHTTSLRITTWLKSS